MNRHLMTAVVAAGIVLAGGGAATAIASAAETEIHGCYTTATGQLRVAPDGEVCRRGETAITWNRTGPQGEQGIPGPQGPEGLQGPAGPAATSPASDAYRVNAWAGDFTDELHHTVVSKSVPAGNYQVIANVYVTASRNDDERIPVVFCTLDGTIYQPPMSLTMANGVTGPYFDGRASLTLVGLATLASDDTISVVCWQQGAHYFSPSAELEIVEVGSVQ